MYGLFGCLRCGVVSSQLRPQRAKMRRRNCFMNAKQWNNVLLKLMKEQNSQLEALPHKEEFETKFKGKLVDQTEPVWRVWWQMRN